MLKGMAWLAKVVAGGLIMSFLCIWTTGYIVTNYVESILKQYELPLDVPPMAVSGVWGKMWGSQPLLADKGEDKSEGTNEQSENNDNSVTLGSEEGKNGEQTNGETDKDSLESREVIGGIDQDPAVKAGSDNNHSPEVPGSEGAELALTPDEMLDVKQEMNQEDKDHIFSLLMLKLPQEALQNISFLMEDGLTESELIQIQQLLAQHLDTEEYDSMMEILKKY